MKTQFPGKTFKVWKVPARIPSLKLPALLPNRWGQERRNMDLFMGPGEIFLHLLLFLWEKPTASLSHAETDCVDFLIDLGFTSCSNGRAGQRIRTLPSAPLNHSNCKFCQEEITPMLDPELSATAAPANSSKPERATEARLLPGRSQDVAEHHGGYPACTLSQSQEVASPWGAQPPACLRETPSAGENITGSILWDQPAKMLRENQSKRAVLTHLFTFGALQSTNTICSLAGDKTRCYKGIGKLKSEESLINHDFCFLRC